MDTEEGEVLDVVMWAGYSGGSVVEAEARGGQRQAIAIALQLCAVRTRTAFSTHIKLRCIFLADLPPSPSAPIDVHSLHLDQFSFTSFTLFTVLTIV